VRWLNLFWYSGSCRPDSSWAAASIFYIFSFCAGSSDVGKWSIKYYCLDDSIFNRPFAHIRAASTKRKYIKNGSRSPGRVWPARSRVPKQI
jgi:hypothetical protein